MAYETIHASDTDLIRIGDGEVLENTLIDLGDEGHVMIEAYGSGWTIRNVGFAGTWNHAPGGGGAGAGGNLMSVADTGDGTSTIENVYFGQGSTDSFDLRGKQIWVNPDHSGHLDVRNVNFSVQGANAIYGSPPNRNSGGNRGSIHLDTCYTFNSHHTGLRVCGPNDEIRDCVVVMTPDFWSSRGIWVESGANTDGPTLIENTHVHSENGTALDIRSPSEWVNVEYIGNNNIRADVVETGTGSNPTDQPPQGVPLSAVEAAEGDVPDRPSEPGDDPVCIREYVDDSVSDPPPGIEPDYVEPETVRIEFQEGELDQRRESILMMDSVGEEPDRAHLRYHVYFPPDFEFHTSGLGGTKMPGFINTTTGGGFGGNDADGTSWSTRPSVVRPDHRFVDDIDPGAGMKMLSAVYHLATDANFGEHIVWNGGYDRDEWVQLDQYVELNDPGSANGIIRAWIDGDMVLDRRDIEYRATTDSTIHRVWMGAYFGGGWGSPKDQYFEYRDVALWSGRSPF